MTTLFDDFFTNESRMFLLATIRIALSEDGPDLTANAVFDATENAQAQIVAKQSTIVAGLPIIPLVLDFVDGDFQYFLNVDDGDKVDPGTMVATLQGPARGLLKAERVIMNYICHLSGIAELTSEYVKAIDDTETYVLDTRKTLPGLRYPEKYAVRVGGGMNHRKNLMEMLMLKDNHIDQAGSIIEAVQRCRSMYTPCPPIEVECRNFEEVQQAIKAEADRIMLDNLDLDSIEKALDMIPDAIETEVSGGVTLETIHDIARLGPDFISVGRLTQSAPASDFSMQFLTFAD